MGTAIEKMLSQAGYKMLGDDESIEKLILDILKTENIRYLKAIPFLIYKHKANINRINKSIKEDRLFHEIKAITIKLFEEFGIRGILPDYNENEFEKYKQNIHKAGLNYKEFKDEFELQLRNETKPSLFIDKQKIYAERDLQMYLSQLFTKKEKQIIRRLIEEKPISRTDYEYYSRKTKKKLSSIIGLQEFAKTIYAKTPKYDQELFDLKKLLERWLSDEWKIDEAIEEYHISNNKIIISSRRKNGETSSSIFRLSKIKDTELLSLLNKYKKHNFR